MSNENNPVEKASVEAKVFGSPNPEHIASPDTMVHTADKQGIEVFHDPATNRGKLMFTLDPNDPDPEASLRYLQEQMNLEGYDVTVLTYELKDVPSSMEAVTKAMREDQSYAWGWHCNLAMAMRDEGVDAMVAERAAARFLQILTTGVGVESIDTRQFDEYKSFEQQYNEYMTNKDADPV